jgi:hypothetical protein
LFTISDLHASAERRPSASDVCYPLQEATADPARGRLAIWRNHVIMVSMKTLAGLIAWLKAVPKSREDLAAERQAARMRDEMTTTRWSARAPAGEFYEAERRRSE